MKKYLAIGDDWMFAGMLEPLKIHIVEAEEHCEESVRWNNQLFSKQYQDSTHFHQFCDTRKEAKTALLVHIKERIEYKDKQIERLNCERSELAKHAVRIEGE